MIDVNIKNAVQFNLGTLSRGGFKIEDIIGFMSSLANMMDYVPFDVETLDFLLDYAMRCSHLAHARYGRGDDDV